MLRWGQERVQGPLLLVRREPERQVLLLEPKGEELRARLREPKERERLASEVPQVCKRKGKEVQGQPVVLLQKRRTWNGSIS